VHLLVSLAGPAPSGSTGTSRRCQGCSRPPRRLPAQASLSSSRVAATTRRRSPFTSARSWSASWRTVSTFRTRETRTGPGALYTPGTAVFTGHR